MGDHAKLSGQAWPSPALPPPYQSMFRVNHITAAMAANYSAGRAQAFADFAARVPEPMVAGLVLPALLLLNARSAPARPLRSS